MDALPFVPETEEKLDILSDILQTFQTEFCNPEYPENVARNYEKYTVDPNYQIYKENGLDVIKIEEESLVEKADISEVENEVLVKHARALIEIDKELSELEPNKLKLRGFYELLSQHARETYGLLDRTHFNLNILERFLDFTLNPDLNVCFKSCPCGPKKIQEVQEPPLQIPQPPVQNRIFQIEPSYILFENYELNHSYKRKIRVINVSQKLNSFTFTKFTKDSPFFLQMVTDTRQLAPGLSAEFLVVFNPKIFRSFSEVLTFKSFCGKDVFLTVSNRRGAPKLTCYVYNWVTLTHAVRRTLLSFLPKRQRALNFSVDCGTSLIGDHTFLSIMMKNEGSKGRFFLTTEREWIFNELQIDESLEPLKHACFSIMPRFFEIDSGEIGQVIVGFHPEQVGLYTEKLVLVCDNNAFQEIELVGDAVLFNSNYIVVDLFYPESKFDARTQCLHYNLKKGEEIAFVLSVKNNSGIRFEYYWTLKKSFSTKNNEETETESENSNQEKIIDPKWIRIVNFSSGKILSFASNDFLVKVKPDAGVTGNYFTILSLYLKNIPSGSIWCENETCDCEIYEEKQREEEKIEEEEEEEGSVEDVCKLGEIGDGDKCANEECDCSLAEEVSAETNEPKTQNLLICTVKLEINIEKCSKPQKIPEEPSVMSLCREKEAKVKWLKTAEFSKIFFNFGLIPKDLTVCKNIVIKNLTQTELKWKVIELKFLEMFAESAVVTQPNNLNALSGTLKKKRKLCYRIQAKECERSFSILALFVQNSSGNYVFATLCFIIYEVYEIKVKLTTETHNLPLLCPKEVFYLELSATFRIYLKNQGISIGCFYFLKPTGNDSHKIDIKFEPNSGILLPEQSLTVKVQLTPLETGIFEDLYVPCFTGNSGKIMTLRILCAVDGINVNVHLPIDKDKFKIFVWPPRSELELDWNFSVVGEGEGETSVNPLKAVMASEESRIYSLIGDNAIGLNYPTVNIGQIHTKTPCKISFYIENISPLHGSFVVEPTNYNCIFSRCTSALVQSGVKKIKEEWEKECALGYGIIVQPLQPSGSLIGYEVIEIELIIYANTWGKYLEEIIVEINDLTPFCFNLAVQVVGLPLELPFAQNTILKGPRLRFGYLTYSTGKYTRSVRVFNSSSLELFVTLHVFDSSENDEKQYPFNFIFDLYETSSSAGDQVSVSMTRDTFGRELGPPSLEVEPREFAIDKLSSTLINITFDTDEFEAKITGTARNYNIVAYIHVKENDKFKENYFRRISGSRLEQLCLSVEVLLEMPSLMLDLHKEDTILNLHVNDLFYNQIPPPRILLIFRNHDNTPIFFKLDIEKPFEMFEISESGDQKKSDDAIYELKSGGVISFNLTCSMNHEQLIQFGEFIYKDANGIRLETIHNFESVIVKNLNIHQVGLATKCVPFELRLHYPEIETSPCFLQFGRCLLFDTKKMILTIKNRTSSLIFFEIYKTVQDDSFVIVPNAGFIPPSTGTNCQLFDLAIYFTPKEPCRYEETIRITTNIPAYYEDIPVAGHGTNNERFHVP